MPTPTSIKKHTTRFKDQAWRNYSLAELGSIVAFFVKRASHRAEPDKRSKDLEDAQNYLNMIQSHLDEAKHGKS